MNQRYTGRVCGAGLIPSKHDYPFFGWCYSLDFVGEDNEPIVCRLGGADIESGLDCVESSDFYGNTDLKVSFVPEQVQVMDRGQVLQFEQRAITNNDGSPEFDAHKHAIFETVTQKDEFGRGVYKWSDLGMVEKFLARQVRFSR